MAEDRNRLNFSVLRTDSQPVHVQNKMGCFYVVMAKILEKEVLEGDAGVKINKIKFWTKLMNSGGVGIAIKQVSVPLLEPQVSGEVFWKFPIEMHMFKVHEDDNETTIDLSQEEVILRSGQVLDISINFMPEFVEDDLHNGEQKCCVKECQSLIL